MSFESKTERKNRLSRERQRRFREKHKSNQRLDSRSNNSTNTMSFENVPSGSAVKAVLEKYRVENQLQSQNQVSIRHKAKSLSNRKSSNNTALFVLGMIIFLGVGYLAYRLYLVNQNNPEDNKESILDKLASIQFKNQIA